MASGAPGSDPSQKVVSGVTCVKPAIKAARRVYPIGLARCNIFIVYG